jgi:hypothetical protein
MNSSLRAKRRNPESLPLLLDCFAASLLAMTADDVKMKRNRRTQ